MGQNSYPGTGITLLNSGGDQNLLIKDGRSGVNWNYMEWQFNDGSRDWVLGRRSSTGYFTLYRQGINEVLTVDNSGNMGIGTTSPAAKLHISNGGFRHGAPGEINIDAIGVIGGRLKILDNGNVGIGTTSPNQKLTVNGTIYGKEVKVDLSVPGPDYVFEPSYKLPSLEELQNYINQNKHLPEVPSAKEMEQNGINVGEMNMILLKKVEELTLYLLEQKKELKELRSEINDLNRKIKN